jgi:FkbM family methyltransferase
MTWFISTPYRNHPPLFSVKNVLSSQRFFVVSFVPSCYAASDACLGKNSHLSILKSFPALTCCNRWSGVDCILAAAVLGAVAEMDPVIKGKRNVTKWLTAPFEQRHHRALIAAATICRRPFDLLRRYANISGDYPASIALRTPVGQISLVIYSWHDARTIHEIFLAQDYRTGGSENVFVDYGSNIGISAAYFLSRNKHSYAYLFEPVSTNAERLASNLRQFEGRYHLEEIAVGLSNGKVQFGIEETGRYGGINQATGRYIEVNCRSSNEILADIIAKHGKIDVLKIDVETMERALIEQLTPDLADKIKLLFVEARFERNILSPSHNASVQGSVTRFQLAN